tara:strand:- start:414 stop:1076 length:663 start_codon:yes stop_codon:yes gene_type:complete
MAGIKLITESNVFPVTINEVKQTLRIDTDNFDQDAELIMMLKSAIHILEEYLGRSFITKTYDYFLDKIPYAHEDYLAEGITTGPDIQLTQNFIHLPKAPIVQVQYFKYYDDADTATTWASSNYYVDTVSIPAKIVLRRGKTYPDSGSLRVSNAFQIRIDAGYGTASQDVPETIKQAINLYVGHLYENRELYIQQKQLPVPMTLATLLQPYRIMRFGSKTG